MSLHARWRQRRHTAAQAGTGARKGHGLCGWSGVSGVRMRWGLDGPAGMREGWGVCVRGGGDSDGRGRSGSQKPAAGMTAGDGEAAVTAAAMD
jgi:hypothetical protein